MGTLDIKKIVRDTVNKMDYLSLLAHGAPRDEFESEIRKICARLKPADSVEEIAAIMADVFNSAFAADESPDKYKKYAEKIFSEMNPPSSR